MTTHDLEQIGGGTRGINGVLGGLQAVEVEISVLVGAELAAQVVAGLVLGVEDVVFAVSRGLPHVEDGVGDALARLGVDDAAVEVSQLAVGGHVLDDGAAELAEGGLGGPERAEDGGGGGGEVLVGGDLVVDLVNEAVGLLAFVYHYIPDTIF